MSAPVKSGPMASVTLDDVAAAAGVSRATASRAINGGQKVSAKAQTAVDEAVARLGYSPNPAARTLVTRRTGSIALVLPEPDARILSDPFLAGLLRGVSDGLYGTDLQLVLLLARRGEAPGRTAQYLRSGHVDGAIVASHHADDQLDEALSDGRLPAVFVGRPFTRCGLHYVDTDNAAGGALAAGQLLNRGCRRPGTVTGPLDMPAAVDRLEGWREQVTGAGLPTTAITHGDFTVDGGARATAELLDLDPEVDGLFVASDLMAIGAMQVLAESGRRVPQDVAVVGYDGLGAADRVSPRLTTVHNPLVEMVAAASQTLLSMLDGEPAPAEPRIFAPQLVEGGTA